MTVIVREAAEWRGRKGGMSGGSGRPDAGCLTKMFNLLSLQCFWLINSGLLMEDERLLFHALLAILNDKSVKIA